LFAQEHSEEMELIQSNIDSQHKRLEELNKIVAVIQGKRLAIASEKNIEERLLIAISESLYYLKATAPISPNIL
jgi:hypothetical protein